MPVGAPEAGQLTVTVIQHDAEATAIRDFRRPIVPPKIEIPGLGDEGARSTESAVEPEVLFRRYYLVVSIWYVVTDGDPNERMPGMICLAHAIDSQLDPLSPRVCASCSQHPSTPLPRVHSPATPPPARCP